MKLAKGGETIKVDEALIIAKSITDDPYFPEEDIFDIIDSDEVNVSRRITEDDFIRLIEVIKKR